MNKKTETTILDSSLNTGQFVNLDLPKIYKNYNIKVLNCKEYLQVYFFNNDKSFKEAGSHDKLRNCSSNTGQDNAIEDSNDVLFKNAMRSKLKLQRLAKCNASTWKTFITCTFKDKITDLDLAYKHLRYYIKALQRVKKDLKWLCVPEYQKSGRVHYHLITNIELGDPNIISIQKRNDKIYYHTKQWQKYGFDSVEEVKDKDGNDAKKLCGYISKYMTKSYIDNSFFNKNRYYCSQNLIQPKEILIDKNNMSDLALYSSLIKNCVPIYTNEYKDIYDNDITFIEFKVNESTY